MGFLGDFVHFAADEIAVEPLDLPLTAGVGSAQNSRA